MLEWTQNLTPIHTGFSDKYYAEEGGLAEARYVYIGQNNLEERFKNSDVFTISELGFGTGLNFLATFELWKRTRSRPTQFLHYISTELFPLQPDEIRNALSPWPEIKNELNDFLYVYAPSIEKSDGFISRRIPHQGFHRFNLSHGVFLSLFIGDAAENLKKAQFQTDAWFLDGFSPRKNPQMWSLDLFQDVARLSKPKATFATFTVAGHVRRNLQEVGFEVEKFAGFGRKKQMLKGILKKSPAAAITAQIPKNILVIGAGFAGASTARELAMRNCNITLVDRHPQIAQEASGNPYGIYYPLLTKSPSTLSKYSLQAYEYLLRILHSTDLSKLSHAKTFGVLQLKRSDKDFERYTSALQWINAPETMIQKLLPKEILKVAGLEIDQEAIYFPEAGALKPSDFCRAQIESQPNIKTLLGVEANADNLFWNTAHQQWVFQKSLEFDAVVLCNAYSAIQFPFAKQLALSRNRGQLCELKSNSESAKLKSIISGDFYLTPQWNRTHLLGATYDREFLETTIRDSDNLELISRPSKISKNLQFESSDILSSRASLRTSTPTKLPILGKLDQVEGPAFVNLGHGSRGLVYSPLSAQILADAMTSMPIAAELDTLKSMKPQNSV